uniref:BHLH domain-containing protein n=1 Tax=Hordeum vulgare subsp. vulgare TaxID=112509 RepID=A0A8I6Y297_HORVV
MSRSHEAARWSPYHAPDEEESEIVAQFLTAPYPCFDGGCCSYDFLGEPDVSLGINTLSYCGSGSSSSTIDLNLSREEGRISKRATPSPAGLVQGGYRNGDGAATAKRKAGGDKGGDLGRHKKKARAADHKGGKPVTSKMAQQSSSYCSDKESDCSQGNRGEEANVGVGCTVKARAGRGPGSDPQSLYAKRRREKINDKLRVLQKLVPNGTKVDLSTMLEEAVLYVKFLQLQIKVLSSDEMWMYAPLAYSGMSLGIDMRITPQ